MREIIVSKLAHTWLIDLDGTIIKHNGYKLDGKDSILPGAIDFFKLIPRNDKIIFLTSRKIEFAFRTESFLNMYGIRYDKIIYDLPYGERILINDIKPAGLRTAIAINLKRDDIINLCINVDKNI